MARREARPRGRRNMASRVALGIGASVAATSFVGGPACNPKPDVSLEIDLPGPLAGNTVWVELGVFGEASCANVRPQLAAGVPGGSAVARVAFRRDANPTPPLGNLPAGS